MVVRSLMVQDYSTGTQYVYGDRTGSWKSIKAVGGTVFSGSNKPVAVAPTITAVASGQPIPFSSPKETDTYTRPNVYPWVPGTTSAAPQPTFANYPGLPAGWSVSDSGKVVPPSSAPVSKPFYPLAPVRPPITRQSTNATQLSQAASYTSLPGPLPSGLPAGSKPSVVTGYDERGFTTLKTIYPGTTAPATLQNNAPAAPLAAKSSASCVFHSVSFQLFGIVAGIVWYQAW
jgi:hypothetical protein